LEANRSAFAAAVGGLVNNEALRRRLAERGRRLAEEVYDWRIIAADFARALRALPRERAGRRGAPAGQGDVA
jgi:glycosyltransferase involved in cell wall biosynthesis